MSLQSRILNYFSDYVVSFRQGKVHNIPFVYFEQTKHRRLTLKLDYDEEEDSIGLSGSMDIGVLGLSSRPLQTIDFGLISKLYLLTDVSSIFPDKKLLLSSFFDNDFVDDVKNMLRVAFGLSVDLHK